jgi:hypothetical protein
VLSAPSGDVDPGAFVPAEGLDVELVLIWSGEADLDLTSPVEAGGQKAASANDFCIDVTDTPVERMVWEAGTAGLGNFPVTIHYSANCAGQAGPVDFILVITPDGNENITRFPYGPAHNIVRKNRG